MIRIQNNYIEVVIMRISTEAQGLGLDLHSEVAEDFDLWGI